MSFLSLDQICFSYPGGFLAVDNVSIAIEKGENVAIVGQNGAGKTTTVKMCNGLLRPTEGSITINGESTEGKTTAQISRIVGYVFQNPDDQIFHATVASEVGFGPKMMKFSPEKTKELVDYALSVTNLTQFAEENPYNLPLSTRKFVTIAAILAMDTEVMIFDEPTAGQDLVGNKLLENILQKLHEQGKTVVTISHDMEFVAKNFDRIIVMANKKVVVDGDPKDIFWNFDALKKANLMQPYVSRVCHSLGIGEKIITMEEAVDAIYAGCKVL